MTRSEQLREIADRTQELSHLLAQQASAGLHVQRVRRELQLLEWLAAQGKPYERKGGEV